MRELFFLVFSDIPPSSECYYSPSLVVVLQTSFAACNRVENANVINPKAKCIRHAAITNTASL